MRDQSRYAYRIQVDKSQWARGKEASESPYLICPKTGKYDIVGKIMLDMGYPKKYMVGKRWPSQVVQSWGQRERIMGELAWMVSKAQADTEECVDLLTVNDDPTLEDDARLKKIADILNPLNFGVLISDKAEPKSKVKVSEVEDDDLFTISGRVRNRAERTITLSTPMGRSWVQDVYLAVDYGAVEARVLATQTPEVQAIYDEFTQVAEAEDNGEQR
jgi:hypothetical protein